MPSICISLQCCQFIGRPAYMPHLRSVLDRFSRAGQCGNFIYWVQISELAPSQLFWTKQCPASGSESSTGTLLTVPLICPVCTLYLDKCSREKQCGCALFSPEMSGLINFQLLKWKWKLCALITTFVSFLPLPLRPAVCDVYSDRAVRKL